jgi:hypothetical protein
MKNFTLEPLLFSKNSLSDYYCGVEQKALKEIRELDRKFFLETNEADLLRHFEEKYRADPLRVDFDDITRSDETVGVDVSKDFARGISDRSKPFYVPAPQVNFHIPYHGDPALFDAAPYIALNPPRGRVDGKYLVVPVVAFDGDVKKILPSFENEKSKIMSTVVALNTQIETLGNKFSQAILAGIRAQKQVFVDQQTGLDALPYPHKTTRIDVTPIQRRKLPISTFPPMSSSMEDNPILPFDEYDFILDRIFSMGRVMESAPDDFKTLSEPALRQQILLALNALYDGQTKGEAFNGAWKTDILITYKSMNLFVGECKFFDGQQSILDALTQLLGYAMWRDTKAALILFSKRKDFTVVLQTVKDAVSKHPNYVRQQSKAGDRETLFRYEFVQKHDHRRKMLLSVLVFNVPTEA